MEVPLQIPIIIIIMNQKMCLKANKYVESILFLGSQLLTGTSMMWIGVPTLQLGKNNFRHKLDHDVKVKRAVRGKM